MTRTPYLAAAALLWLLSLPVAALRLDLLPIPATANLMSSTDLTLEVSGLDADQQIVSSYDVLLAFDPTIVHATAVTFGPSLGGAASSFAVADLATAGQVELSEVSFLSDADLFALQGDTVTLATLTFSAVGLGTSSVQIGSSFLTGKEDPQAPGFATVLDPELGGTRIIVQQVSIPEPGSLLLLLAALGAATLSSARRSRVISIGLSRSGDDTDAHCNAS